ncbi:probable G-protein coupled receptor Mth-like 2 isoform X1 [Drosophila biarmipes]|uniref:probable G-protein coupled receptor Mth-like 2 isoform X1 n=1 Tax=Drosophila biarmipes TaxID=125945 RepID=UPI0007E7E29A|nr:probable G-protein coupled receptor Mth-like 2 isoform X1 [Drosophila biarmipes]
MGLLIGLVAGFVLLMLPNSNAEIVGCDFFDTVDISEGKRLANGSVLYEDLLIPADLTGEYDFKLLGNGSKEAVASHIRGCVCQLRSCVRFCCPHNHLIKWGACNSNTTTDELSNVDPFLSVTLNNGSVVKMHYRKDLVVQWDLPKPCQEADLYFLDDQVEMEKYTLLENETLLRHFDSVILDKADYCFQHLLSEDGNVRITPHHCPMLTYREPSNIAQADVETVAQTVVMILSLTCMVLTIGVYLFVKKLRNLYGKCFVCYMSSLFLAYLLLLLDLWHLTSGLCLTAGFLGYFFVMAVFFWLSVISLDLFNGMKGVLVSENRFLAYNCYAWGMSVALTVVTFLADKFVENQDWNPRMGALGFCWIYTKEWSAMLYFFGPILVLILFNMTLFILMAIPLISSKRALRKFARKEGRKQKLKSDKQNYALFLRLFVVMGLTWSLEIISYLVQNTKWAKALLVADYLNWSLGLVIFVVFIMRTSTLDLLKMQILPKHQRSGLSIKSKVSRTTTAESLSQYPGPNQSFSMQNSSSA